MKRVMAIVLIAVLTAVVSGIDAASLGNEDQDARKEEARRQTITARINDIAVGSIVKIEETDGKKLSAAVVEATPDALTIIRLEGATVRTQTIASNSIKKIEVVRRRAVRIERIDGETFKAELESVTRESITVTPVSGKSRATETIAIGEIRSIEPMPNHLARNVLIGIGIFVGVCTGITLSTV